MTPAEAVEAADLAEAETRYRLQFAREMFAAGYMAAEADMAERWARAAAPVVHGRAYAELEERRWGPGGREHFADPRPDDYVGRGAQQQAVACDPEPELELEAG